MKVGDYVKIKTSDEFFFVVSTKRTVDYGAFFICPVGRIPTISNIILMGIESIEMVIPKEKMQEQGEYIISDTMIHSGIHGGDINSNAFKEIVDKMFQTYKAKNADYGNSFDKSMDEFGITSAVVRMSDKMERIKSLTNKKEKVNDESIQDTLLDLANYAILIVTGKQIGRAHV